MTHARHLASVSLVTLAIALAAPLASLPAFADAPLSGAITSATGERMGGVTVSAKAEGSTITTSVYTDAPATTISRRCRKETTGSGRRRCSSRPRATT